MLSAVNFDAHVVKEQGSQAAAEARLRGVEWLKGSVGRFEQRTRDKGKQPRWHEYFGTVQLDNNTEDKEEVDQGKVTLATLHSAKGLEWDHVFIIGVEEGTMPHRRVMAQRASDAIAGDLEEERRLFYVGITRAREQLWLTRGASRRERGQQVPREPSRFIEELPETHVHHYDIRNEEELSSTAIGDMADAFLSQIKPPGSDEHGETKH